MTAPALATDSSLDDYILTYEMSSGLGLFPVDSKMMSYVGGDVGKSPPDSNDKWDTIPIGFEFNFCSKTYSQITISSSGWITLLPVGASFSINDILDSSTNSYDNYDIHISTDRVLLAPWFSLLRNTYRTAEDAYNDGEIPSIDIVEGIKSGKIVGQYPYVDNSSGGIKYFRGKSNQGNYILVRWKSYSSNYFRNIFSFDVIIYENGNIEYRYAPITTNPVVGSFQYTIGIFGESHLPGENYRDFSYILKPDTSNDRKLHKFGGATYNGSYTDNDGSNTSKYTIALNAKDHWPAKGHNGAIFRFVPPRQKRRHNRKWIGKSGEKKFFSNGMFDDRKTVPFTAQNVYYPAGMPVNYPIVNSFEGTHLFVDLLTSGSIEVERTASAVMFDRMYAETQDLPAEDGFVEFALHDQGRSSEEFFATGSQYSIGDEPGSFSQQLSSKEQIRLSFQIDNSVSMLPNSSSIYYLNFVKKQWNIPTRSINDHVGPFDKFSFLTLWSNPSGSTNPPGYTYGNFFTEDFKCFNPYGFPIASGSKNIFSQSSANFISSNQNFFTFGSFSDETRNKMVMSMADDYPKSVTRNQDFAPGPDESFIIPVDEQFLLEKASIEIPFAAGPSWFSDYTTTCISEITKSTYNNKLITNLNGGFPAYVVDRGGPALTVSLFCQKRYRNDSILELIAWNSFTHDDDINNDIRVNTRQILSGTGVPWVAIEPRDFSRNNVTSASIVFGTSGFFTGSVLTNLESKVTNGTNAVVVSFYNGGLFSGKTESEALSLVRNSTFESELYTSFGSETFYHVDTKPFGRSMKGFEPIGSAFGREFSSEFEDVNRAGQLKNPFYDVDIQKNKNAISQFTAVSQTVSGTFSSFPSITRVSRINLSKEDQVPYMLSPGDKLVLAITKARPATKAITYNIANGNDADVGRGTLKSFEPIYTETTGHDVKLMSGSVNITLYGSYPREGKG